MQLPIIFNTAYFDHHEPLTKTNIKEFIMCS